MVKNRLLTVACVLLALSGALVAPVAAQESDGSGSTSVNETAQAAAQAASEETEYAGSISPTLRVVSYSYSDGTMSITLESDVPNRVVLSGVSTGQAGGEGVTNYPVRAQNIPPGRTTLKIAAADAGGHARVSVASGTNAAMVAERTGTALFYGTPNWSQLGMVSGFAAVVGAVLPAGLVWRRKRKEEQEVRRTK